MIRPRLSIILASLLLAAPTAIAFAADSGFVPLAPIPGVTDGKTTNFGDFFNDLFHLLVVAAGMLAVIRIGYAGILYMTTESLHGKGEAKEKIEDALIGLLIALGVYLILYTINPNLVFIDGVKPVYVTGEKVTGTGIKENSPSPREPTPTEKKLIENGTDPATGGMTDVARMAAGAAARNDGTQLFELSASDPKPDVQKFCESKGLGSGKYRPTQPNSGPIITCYPK